MAKLSDMLSYLRQRESLTQQELADKLGITRSAIGMYETGNREPDLETLELFADFYNVDMNTLTGHSSISASGSGGMSSQKGQRNLPTSESPAVSEKELAHIKKYRVLDIYNRRLVDDVLDAAYNNMTRDINPEERGMAYLNCYELPAAAGTGEPLGDTYYTDKIQIPLNRVPENAHICIRVHGDSMEPAYHDGDIVMVERFDGDSVREGEIGIFILNGEGYIKRLGYGELISLNPAYEPIRVGEFDDLRCMGRVLGKV